MEIHVVEARVWCMFAQQDARVSHVMAQNSLRAEQLFSTTSK